MEALYTEAVSKGQARIATGREGTWFVIAFRPASQTFHAFPPMCMGKPGDYRIAKITRKAAPTWEQASQNMPRGGVIP